MSAKKRRKNRLNPPSTRPWSDESQKVTRHLMVAVRNRPKKRRQKIDHGLRSRDYRTMSGPFHLQVRVNLELVRVIHPPRTTLFDQVLNWLREQPDPPKTPSGSLVGREGVAAAALTLRWGSYLAVLLDQDKPVWPQVTTPGVSRISDQEMARINIEASAGLAAWVDLYRADPLGEQYQRLVNRAVAWLPMPKKTSKRARNVLPALASADMAARLVAATHADRLEQRRAEAEQHPSRVLSNVLVNMAWRNGPVENLHAGKVHDLPLDRRRFIAAEERELMAHACGHLATGMDVCLLLAMEPSERPWPEQVRPFGVAGGLVTPSRWTLTEACREVRLPGHGWGHGRGHRHGRGCQELRVSDHDRVFSSNDMEARVAAGRFRSDLFHRLSVIPIHLPSLRERPEDIELLVRSFLDELCDERVEVSPALLTALQQAQWPGNIRELRNTVSRMALLRRTTTLDLADLVAPSAMGGQPAPVASTLTSTLQPGALVLPAKGFNLPALEREIIEKALALHDGNRSATARYLDIPRHVLLYRLARYAEGALEGETGGQSA